MKSDLSASRQDYLEAILELSNENGQIRSIDIAEKLSVSRASVNKAIGILKTSGYVIQERYSYLSLTDSGKNAAGAVKERHSTIKCFLIDLLGVSEATAESDACKIEHCISPETLEKLKMYLNRSSGNINI